MDYNSILYEIERTERHIEKLKKQIKIQEAFNKLVQYKEYKEYFENYLFSEEIVRVTDNLSNKNLNIEDNINELKAISLIKSKIYNQNQVSVSSLIDDLNQETESLTLLKLELGK